MLPTWIPFKRAIIYATGLLEIVIALLLFSRRWRRIGGMLSMIVLIGFFPVNVYAAINHLGEAEHALGVTYLWVRAPLQLSLLAWSIWPMRASRPD